MDETAIASRRAAIDILSACLDKGQPLDDALGGHRGFASLEARDRAFVRLLLATTMRRLGEIDAVVGRLVERPIAPQDNIVRHVLRLGVTQLLFLGTPAHASVDTSVRLVEKVASPHLKGLVNAVLRRIVREGTPAVAADAAARLNTPNWLWESWVAAYGLDQARAIAAAHQIEAPLDLTAKAQAELWAERLKGELLPTGTIRRTFGGSVVELPGFAEGTWWVQDAAAALPVRLLGDLTGKRVADLCAAPGGKTMQLCAAGAEVTAVDVSARRLSRLRENLARANFEAETVALDVGKWQPTESFDSVLLDAPCSGTGTLRRHPDIAWLKGPADVERLSMTQDRLLLHAVDLLKPGGTMVYASCSLQEEEGPHRIAALLAREPRLKRDPVAPQELPALAEAVTPEGDVRTLPSMWPERGGIDGFFITRLRRSA